MSPIQVLPQLAKVLHFWGPHLTDSSIQKHNRIQWMNEISVVPITASSPAVLLRTVAPWTTSPTVESKAKRRSRCSRQTLTDAALFARLLHTRTFRPRHSTDLSRSPVIIQSCPRLPCQRWHSTVFCQQVTQSTLCLPTIGGGRRCGRFVRRWWEMLLLGCRGFKERKKKDFL